MSLFQPSVLKSYLKAQDEEAISIAFKKYAEYFHSLEIQQNIRASKEEQFQEGFLRELFVNVLGYTLNPTPEYNLTTELKNETDSKKCDGAILKDGKALAVIELKGMDTTNLDKVNDQAFSYKNNQSECIYVITSNFEKLRFFIHNAVEYVEFNLFTLSRDEFGLFWFCLSENSLLNNLSSKAKEESVVQEQEITKKLYSDYANFKNELWLDLIDNNESHDHLLLYKKSQKILDRFLFILFSEDCGLLPPNTINHEVSRWEKLQELDAYRPLYDVCKQYFGYINVGKKGSIESEDIFSYNGGLFYPDEIIDNLVIGDEVLKQYLSLLTIYDFKSEVDVNILGHIFENSLNDIDNAKARIAGKEVKKQDTKRNKDGVFYTPKYITKFMVDSSVGKLCSEKRNEFNVAEDKIYSDKKKTKKTIKQLNDNLNNYRDWLLGITICDPACGSGAFLNQTLEYLIKEHAYIDELEAKLFGSGFVFRYVSDHILENNIFGVDINEESIEIAKLSLWLRTAERGRKLSSLNKNIRCGDSLLNSSTGVENGFDWAAEFPDVFNDGGFDVIIGNPPYVDLKSLDNDMVENIFKHYSCSNNRVNLFSAFTEKSISLLNTTGYFSFIIPSSILTQDSYSNLRKLILDKTNITKIVRLPNESFGGGAGEVKVDTIILTLNITEYKNDTEVITYIGFDRISEISKYNCDQHSYISQALWNTEHPYNFKINVSNEDDQILAVINSNSSSLINCAEFCLGLTPYDKYRGHTQEQIKGKAFHSDHKKDSTFKKLLAGNDVTRYNVTWNEEQWISYGEWLGAAREPKYFTGKRILVKQIIDWTDKKIWAAVTDEELYNTQNAFNLIAKEEYSTEFLAAVINSSLMSYYHRKTFLEEFKDRFQKILIKDAKEFPIKLVCSDLEEKVVNLVNEMTFNKAMAIRVQRKFFKYICEYNELDKKSKKLYEWPKLEFKPFVKEINKQLKLVNKLSLTKKEEIELHELFAEYKNDFNEEITSFNNLDKKLDDLIFDIYGLNERQKNYILDTLYS